jgi:integrase
MQVTNETLQAIVNDYAPGHSSKTVKNMSCFIVSVLSAHNITLKSPTLPQTERKSPYIPTKEDVSRIFEYLSGTKYEVPITLAALGLRRSEICALTIDDLNGNVLRINKALVQDKAGKWVVKTTKTTASTRTIIIPDELADLIREQGCVYEGFPAMIYKHLKMAQNDLGIPSFTLHKLRHFFASYMHDLGYTDKQIQEAGGWRDGSRVMKIVYQHAMDMDEAKKGMSDSIGRLRK